MKSGDTMTLADGTTGTILLVYPRPGWFLLQTAAGTNRMCNGEDLP